MTSLLDTRTDLAKEMLVACDQAYVYDAAKRPLVTTGMAIGALDDSAPENDAPLPYALPDPDFQIAHVFEEPQTGFKCLIYKHATRDEMIVAMAGTDGVNFQDWAQNLNWGWLQWASANSPDRPKTTTGESARLFDVIQAVKDGSGNRFFKPATTRIHFTGQSLGGALAEYAAFDWWRELARDEPDILSRITLTTFNLFSSVDPSGFGAN